MPFRFCLTALLLFTHLASANSQSERLQAIRSTAFTACSSLLLYYNPNQDNKDPVRADDYHRAMDELQALLRQEQDPTLSASGAQMQKKIIELEQQPSKNTQLYPSWINPVLEAQAHLDKEAARQYAAAPALEARVRLVHELALDVDRLLLLYQTRTFGSLGVYIMSIDDTTFATLDQQIVQGLDSAEQNWPQRAAEVAKLKSKYTYIRPRLLQHERDWVPDSAAYYLGQVANGLGQLSNP